MDKLHDYLLSNAKDDLLPWTVQVDAAKQFGMTCRMIEEAVLQMGLLPVRYQRNRQTISTNQQLRLFRSKVAVIGCGGLGGYIIEELARLGIGQIVIVDPDVFVEHNLNRQILSSISSLGRSKVEVAEERITKINPVVKVTPVMNALTEKNGKKLLQGMNVAVDALDSIQARLELSEVCKDLGIPLVHGGVAGWYGQVATQFPEDDILKKIYARCKDGNGIESDYGNLSFTPGVVASIESAEVCKILLDQGSYLRHSMLSINLLDMEIVKVQLS